MLSKRVLSVLSCVLAGVIAAPAEVPPEKLQPTVIPIVSQSEELEPNGTYKFRYLFKTEIQRSGIVQWSDIAC